MGWLPVMDTHPIYTAGLVALGLAEICAMPLLFVWLVSPRRRVLMGKSIRVLWKVTCGFACIWLFVWVGRSTTPHDTVSQSTPTPVAVMHSIGEEFSVGYWLYLCNGATWTRMIPSPGGAEFPDGIFAVVDITVQNNDRSSSTLPPLHLLDSDGRQYDASSKPMWEGRFLGPLEDLNPGVSKRGLIAFDIPPNRHYTLQVSGGFRSGESALVNITTLANPASEESSPPRIPAMPPNPSEPNPQPSTEKP